MNQIKKRLQIINIAISITDMETIQLQLLKLTPLQADKKLQTIIQTLQAYNYVQATQLIEDYIENAPNEMVYRKSSDEETIEAFELIPTKSESSIQEIKDIQLDEFLKQHPDSTQAHMHYEAHNIDAFLNISSDDVLKDTIALYPQQPTTPKESSTSEQPTPQPEPTPQVEATPPQEPSIPCQEEIPTQTIQTLEEEEEENITYPPVPHIQEKYQHLFTQYPPMEIPTKRSSVTEVWMKQLQTQGCNEKEIEEMIDYIQNIRKTNRAEAAELFLLTIATPSLYAQFHLARELYKGELLQQNIEESVNIMSHLANNENFPEAMCDLAQFYEYGIGVKKNTKEAERLYKEAMEAGVLRAIDNYERVHQANKSFLHFFSR